MRLELKQTAGEAVRAGAEGWSFERGRRTLGRGADCDWQVPDPRRLVSKHHCTIERDREGFVLRDQSANGSRVDGSPLREGDTARLRDGSRIEFGGLAFSVRLSGEPDRDLDDPDTRLTLSDEPLTISSILADVAPGGRTGTGILGRHGDDLSGLPLAAQPRKSGIKSSRDVEIGWEGPPQTGRMTRQILPDDWNADFDNSNRYEHQPATHVSVAEPRGRRKSAPAPDQEATEATVSVPLVEEPAKPVGTGTSPAAAMQDVSPLLQRLENLLGQMDEALAGAYSTFELDPPAATGGDDFLTGDREQALIDRFHGLVARQVRLNGLLERLVSEASRMLEPRILEARVDAAPRKLPWLSDRSYWRAYCAQFEKDDRHLSLRELFRAAMVGSEEEENSRHTAGRIRPDK
jgi:type VI secretion system protein ImpI